MVASTACDVVRSMNHHSVSVVVLFLDWLDRGIRGRARGRSGLWPGRTAGL